MALEGVECELKLSVTDPLLLDRLAEAPAVGPFAASVARLEVQHNAYFDTAKGSLRAARLAFRRRTSSDASLAAWTVKGAGSVARGIANRPEAEVWLDADTAPMVALQVVVASARAHKNAVLAEQMTDALTDAPPPLARPFVEMQTERRIRDLTAPERGWAAELALDRVRLVGHAGYEQLEIEVELRRGDEVALEAAREALQGMGQVEAATHSKLSRAMAHLATCHGC